jgi:hypothetical protein
MRRTLVWIAMLGALGVLTLRLWPRYEEAPGVRLEEPPARIVPLAGTADLLDEATCAAPMFREMLAHRGWKFTLREREWDDVVDDNPDELIARVELDAHGGTWTDGDLPEQTIALEPAEQAELLAAAARSCARTNPGNGYTGYYIEIGLGGGDAGAAIKLPSESRAALDVIAVLDHARGRYVLARQAAARAMTLTLAGRRRNDGWERWHVTIRPDGHVVDADGDVVEPLAALEQVDVLDWALQLPAKVTTKNRLIGTLEIAGTRRSVAVDLDAIHDMPSAWRNGLFTYFMTWAAMNRGPS